ncbi:MAG: VWA domain-containing protein, partial [bacterium]|nr:VWA domain-containing protein [bacterium]
KCPLTRDYGVLATLLGDIDFEDVGDPNATAIGMAVATAANRLKDSEAKSKVIILLTDGINNAGAVDPLTAAELCHSLGVRVYTIGVGSSKKKVKQLSRSVEQLTKNTNSASMAFASMKGMLGASAIQGAVTRIAGGMARMVKSAAQYHNFMDQTRIGLRTIMGQVEQVNGKALGFAAAGGL